MPRSLDRFEAIVRAVARLPRPAPAVPVAPPPAPPLHPFDNRNIHPDLQTKVRKLFDDGYYPEATIHAFKHLESKVHRHSGIASQTGQALMMAAFDGTKIKLNGLVTLSETDEQEGYRFIFAGGTRGIRNPRGHDPNIVDDPDICLDHLSFVSMLLRRLEQAGYK
ncbi:MAG TPA: TIGR02391 family protein [Candidatus Acidoferrum sp.]|nr:TIGR02391 family protein [Candidatus Acidoferrum sp.]